MNPSAQDVLRGCVENLEELVTPELTSPHAKSALMCVRMLINHVILRMDLEGDALAADCVEKREMFRTLTAEGKVGTGVAEEVEAMLRSEEPLYTSVAALTARDDEWKRLTERALADASDETRATIRRQLASQVSRENSYCGPALDGPMF